MEATAAGDKCRAAPLPGVHKKQGRDEDTSRPCSCDRADRRSPDRIRQLVTLRKTAPRWTFQPFMQSDMNFLRSSAVMPFDFVLQVAILFSDSFFLFDKQLLMNFLRSSPFLSPAS